MENYGTGVRPASICSKQEMRRKNWIALKEKHVKRPLRQLNLYFSMRLWYIKYNVKFNILPWLGIQPKSVYTLSPDDEADLLHGCGTFSSIEKADRMIWELRNESRVGKRHI